MTKLRFDAPQDLGNVLAASDSSESEADALRWFDAGGPEGLALAIRKGQTARESDFALGTRWLSARVADGGASRAEASERPASGEQSSPTRAGIGSERPADASASSGSASAAAVTIANGATVEIDGPSAQSVTFEGTTGTLKLQDAVLFTGLVSGLSGARRDRPIRLRLRLEYQSDLSRQRRRWRADGDRRGQDGAHRALRQLPVVDLDAVQRREGRRHRRRSDDLRQLADPQDRRRRLRRRPRYRPRWLHGGAHRRRRRLFVERNQWVQLVTATSLPAAFVAANSLASSSAGVYEIQMAPSNSNIMYMMLDGYIFSSTNKGTTWTQTSFAQVSADPNASTRQYGQKIAIDPNNPNIVYVGTPRNGLWVTTNGGTSWSQRQRDTDEPGSQ